ncbi:MAG TPA: asparagine synthase-related protein [Acidimicrobiales bacterium]|nr:asparagine synthase-related protein [Acidimicrobiales bacterium]
MPSRYVCTHRGIDPLAVIGAGQPGGSRSFAALVKAELVNYLQAALLPDPFPCVARWSSGCPYPDRDFLAAAVNAFGRQRRPGGNRSLGDALDDPFLLSITRRSKRGFSVPMGAWLRDGPLQLLARELGDQSAPVRTCESRGVAPEALAGHRPEGRSRRWSVMPLNRWLNSLDAPVAEHEGIA